MKNDWEIFIVIDPDLAPAMLYSPNPHRPVWVVDSPSNRGRIHRIKSVAKDSPTSIFTIFNPSVATKALGDLSALIEMLEMHHPYLARLNVMGASVGDTAFASLASCGFAPAKNTWPDTLAFKRTLPTTVPVPELRLEARDWRSEDDVYDSLFAVLGSPTWHGRNFDALDDSIVSGDVNYVEVPFNLVVQDLNSAQPGAQAFARELVSLFEEFENEGCPVSMKINS